MKGFCAATWFTLHVVNHVAVCLERSKKASNNRDLTQNVGYRYIPVNAIKNKKHRQSFDYQCFCSVGMTGFEPATTRPPDAYSNRAELHPAAQLRCKGTAFF